MIPRVRFETGRNRVSGLSQPGPKKDGSRRPVSASGGPGQFSGINPAKHFIEHLPMLKWPNRQVKDFK
jgi:hypothetical protein